MDGGLTSFPICTSHCAVLKIVVARRKVWFLVGSGLFHSLYHTSLPLSLVHSRHDALIHCQQPPHAGPAALGEDHRRRPAACHLLFPRDQDGFRHSPAQRGVARPPNVQARAGAATCGARCCFRLNQKNAGHHCLAHCALIQAFPRPWPLKAFPRPAMDARNSMQNKYERGVGRPTFYPFHVQYIQYICKRSKLLFSLSFFFVSYCTYSTGRCAAVGARRCRRCWPQDVGFRKGLSCDKPPDGDVRRR